MKVLSERELALLDKIKDLPEQITLEGHMAKNELRVNGKKLSLKKSLRVENKSPSGFNWGYTGSGPAQASLGILLEFLPKEDAQRLYQSFKFAYVSKLPQTDFIKTVPLRAILEKIVTDKEYF